jgi:hypothetical protein
LGTAGSPRPASASSCGSGNRRATDVVQDRQVELAEAVGIRNDIDFRNLAVDDREVQYSEEAPASRDDESNCAVDDGWLREACTARERDCDLGPRCARAADLLLAPGRNCRRIDSDDDIRSSTATSASKSPARKAARKASTTCR